jgi:hypothetical protein
VLLTAVNAGLFTLLAKKHSSLAEVKNAMNWNCSDRHALDFLDTLVALHFLNREGIGATAVYSNSTDSEVFLDQSKPSYIGGMLAMANNRLFRFWADLDEAMKTGEAQNEIKHGGENLFAELYNDTARLKEFVHAMAGVQMGNFMALGQSFNFAPYKTLCDVGGASGMLCIQVAAHQPHMTCTTFDLAPVSAIAEEYIERFDMKGKVMAAAGDFFTDPIPQADIITMGNILHDWDEEKKLALMKKAYDTLPENGVFIAVENVIDNERRSNVMGLTMSLNMLIETGHGFDYTFDDFTGWAMKVGFKKVELLPLAGPSSAAIAYK